MRNSQSLVLALVLSVGLSLPVLAADSLEGLRGELEALANGLRSAHAETSTTLSVESDAGEKVSLESNGQLWYLVHDDTPYFKSERTVVQESPDTGEGLTQRITATSKGNEAVLVAEIEGHKVARKISSEEFLESNLLLGTHLLDAMTPDHTLKLLPDESQDGMDLYVLEAALEQAQQVDTGIPAKTKVYISKQDGLVRRVVMFSKAGEEIGETRFSNIEQNIEIDPATFSMAIPEDAQVVESEIKTLDLESPAAGEHTDE